MGMGGWSEAFSWVEGHPALVTGLGVASVVTFVGTLLTLPWIVARMPEDYFLPTAHRPWWTNQHPVLRWTLRVAKNLLGAVFLVAGVAMLVLPGQGILTILIGLGLLEFPGKRALELRLARRRSVKRAIAWLRRRSGRPPLRYPDDEPGNGSPSPDV